MLFWFRGLKKRKSRHHTVISGNGRAGTTFLVELFTNLKIDTGFSKDELKTLKFSNCNAGLERDIRNENSPYIDKDPWFCDYIEEVVINEKIILDFLIIPLRDMHTAALSRIHVSMQAELDIATDLSSIPGGLWHTNNPEEQESVLYRQLVKLLLETAKTHIKIILIEYPKMMNDSYYLYKKLKPVLKRIRYKKFYRVYELTIDKKLLHLYNENGIRSDLNHHD